MDMKRRHFLSALLATAVVLPGAALAQTAVDRVAAVLTSAGYRDITVSRTLLGRTRITGQRGDRMREIVMNGRSGEILRDIVFGPDGKVLSSGVLAGEDDDSDDDDGDDDDDDSSADDGDGDDDGDDDDGDDGGDDDDSGDDGDDDDGGDGDGGDDDDD
jgi:hypothetical protein